LKEYGSNIQKLVGHLKTIEDREKRTRYAHILVELMRQIHPNMRDNQDYYNKLWDDLYIMSGFSLDVDSPYPPPPPDVLGKKPQTVPYNTHDLRYKHYGHNMKLLIEKALALQDMDERRAFVSYLTRLMKTFYQTWNKDTVEDETILQNLLELSNGRLGDDIELIRTEGLVEASPRERAGDQQPRRSQPNQNFSQHPRSFNKDGNQAREGGHRNPNNQRNDRFRGGNQNNRRRR